MRRSSYQLCLFCYDRLKTEFSNRCPNCRVEYDSDFQAGLRRRQERVAQLQREATAQAEAAALAAKAAPAAAGERPGGKHVQPPPPPPPPPPRAQQSPRRDLRIGQEQLWPSLGAAPQQLPLHTQPQPQPHTPPAQRQAPEACALGLGSPPQLAALLPQPASSSAEQEASSSSSADTAATTPQSPVSSVVCFRALPPPGCAASKPAAPPAAAAPVQGRCAVVLQRGGGLGVDSDPEGASLAASLQDAVRAGSLSVKQAAASLASYLRQSQLLQAAALGGSASSSPARGSHQPSSAGSTGAGGPGITPFTLGACAADCATGLLGGEASLMLPSDSGFSATTSASLSHWAPSAASSLCMPPGLFGGGTAAAAAWPPQAQPSAAAASPLAASPVRDNGKMPLFLRRGSIPVAPSLGSPSSAGGPSSPSSAASFPGFPSGSSSPTAELKRMMAPPPGFGPTPLGSTGIATLPRFR
ncbi:hypothetical protein CHLNCDRAFT_135482 [Chlorella variabilis]|uniref:Uncharacterized protein n=1 Tax=Chlorella variabilis TaxID=554065 RepID=E1ZI99_CHLVA|nr:hypothetical protein CHLNCDRAFT_135482 [Chlorella variabilis]EFN54299.1 hypothetical protein CHLNCDRAFT_135482 [Chlorella variabilis]|eukprot:XP_005846401.1 hypothetical protein CHLNCDRAFT_135482 [Chlorella variabilis]